MTEPPHTLKIATAWLLLLLVVFLAMQWWLREQQQARFHLDGGVVEIRRGPDGHYHWPGTIGGHPVDFLVDTGATGTVIPAGLARKLGLPLGEAVPSRTAGGDVVGHATHIDLALQGGLRVDRLRVLALPDLDMPLLGMNVLGRLHWQQRDGVLRVELDGA